MPLPEGFAMVGSRERREGEGGGKEREEGVRRGFFFFFSQHIHSTQRSATEVAVLP